MYKHRVDYRTRSDRTERRVLAFKIQMDAITDAYLKWSYEDTHKKNSGPLPEDPQPNVLCEYPIRIIGTYGGLFYAAGLAIYSQYDQIIVTYTSLSTPSTQRQALYAMVLFRAAPPNPLLLSPSKRLSYTVSLTYDPHISPFKHSSKHYVICMRCAYLTI